MAASIPTLWRLTPPPHHLPQHLTFANWIGKMSIVCGRDNVLCSPPGFLCLGWDSDISQAPLKFPETLKHTEKSKVLLDHALKHSRHNPLAVSSPSIDIMAFTEVTTCLRCYHPKIEGSGARHLFLGSPRPRKSIQSTLNCNVGNK